MSSALRVYFLRANTFSDKCRRILLQHKTHSSITCGFALLLKILGTIFPHMGSMPYNVNDKIAKMTFGSNETYDSLYERLIDIEKEVEMSLHRVSNTGVIEKFLDMLMTIPDVVPRLSGIFAELKSHIKGKGPNVDFHFSLEDIYDHLIYSGIPTSNEINTGTSSLPNGPQAYVAIVSTNITKLFPDKEARKTTTLTERTGSCPVCMADYSANPIGNPFNDVILSDVDNPLVEY